MNADGSGQHQLTGCAPSDPSPCAAGDDFGPAWSPDGTKIVFLRDRPGPRDRGPAGLRDERRRERPAPDHDGPDHPRCPGVAAARRGPGRLIADQRPCGRRDPTPARGCCRVERARARHGPRRKVAGDSVSTADVQRAMRGDHDAFAALVTAATSRLYALACLILRDPDRAEDATQEAFVRAWRELPRLRDADRFDAWLRRLVVNACYDEARRVTRRAEVSLFSSPTAPSSTPPPRAPSRTASSVPSASCRSTSGRCSCSSTTNRSATPRSPRRSASRSAR